MPALPPSLPGKSQEQRLREQLTRDLSNLDLDAKAKLAAPSANAAKPVAGDKENAAFNRSSGGSAAASSDRKEYPFRAV